jgi:ABC-type glycerol-3-phosphate transport system substrate-binding protein
MQGRAVILATALALAPISGRAADLVVWWDKAFYPEEDQALAELTRAFEAKAGFKVEFVRHEERETPEKIEAAIAAGQPPDFLFELTTPSQGQLARWAAEDRLVDLSDVIGGRTDLFDQDLLDLSTLVNAHTGRRGLYALPMGRKQRKSFERVARKLEDWQAEDSRRFREAIEADDPGRRLYSIEMMLTDEAMVHPVLGPHVMRGGS